MLTMAIVAALGSQAATRIELGQGVQFEGALSAAELRPTSTEMTTADGSIKRKYQQFHQGVRIWGEAAPVAQFSVGQDGKQSDAPAFNDGTLISGLAADLPNTKPVLSEAQVAFLTRQLARRQGHVLSAVELEKSELVVRLDEKSRAQLVYLTSLHIPGEKPASPSFMIDANTGAVLMSWDGLAHRDAHGPGGNPKMGQYYYGKEYKAMEITNDCSYDNANVATYDMGNRTAEVRSPYKLANCPATGIPVNTQRVANGAYSPLNDGHFFGGVVFNMFRDWYGIRPLKDKLIVRVHYGTNYQNAFWDGQRMTFGDGGSSLYPLVSLGVMAHEVSHGVTEQNSGLVYARQSGGMNEAFSDMSAQAAEFYHMGKASMLIGAEIYKRQGQAMRYMLNPEQDGASIGHASKYNDNMDVHHSSGVYNKAYALLATTSGWDARKAFDVFLGANRLYWKANSTFNEGACGVISATRDKGYNINDVISAFDKVGVRCASVPPQPGNTATAIANGATVSNLQANAAGQLMYVVDVPANATFLTVRLGNGSGNANLYVKQGALASTSSFDASSTGASNAETVLIKSPRAGKAYLLIDAKAAVSGLSLYAYAR
ncbi:M4 family metallopeptidase [Chitinimonas prasina]|nr:M4 family metallopeptidase [Chitinimonas prasina]